MTLEDIKRLKKEIGFTNEDIARRSGIPLGTVQKIFSGSTSSPRYQTLRALEKVFADTAAPSVPRPHQAYTLPVQNQLVREPSPAYGARNTRPDEKRQGTYTVEDYMNYPEDQRIELIDGVIYDMAAPIAGHQVLAAEIHHQLSRFVRSNKGSCIPLMSPIDVQLDCDDKTMVRPDVMVLCRKDRLKKGRVFGAPDFVVEVLSPSTRSRDMILKLGKYQNAGVREYWLVDPGKKQVITYQFNGDDMDIAIHGFTEKVPVGIYEGRCCIDFPEIQAMIDSWGEDLFW